ncbi:MAG: hypothetical protein OEX07_00400 [Gammaproteobacteria bacterium]|nr:hypothetical protein [Gammaproteobacteria bacterium]
MIRHCTLISLSLFLNLALPVVSFANSSANSSGETAETSLDAGASKKCVLVMSYHKGYEWNDGIESGVIEKLAGVCQLKKIYMDTKRNTGVVFGKAAGSKAKRIIDKFKPDILIAADDNASRYLVQRFYKDSSLPVIFCGVNWSAEEYGYPYQNATGMVEVAPISPLLKNIQRSIGVVKQGVYLSSDVITEHTDYLRYEKEYIEHGVTLKPVFVSNTIDWKREFVNAQKADFIIVGNNGGINDWDEPDITQFVLRNSKVLTVTNYQWMMSYAMLGMTKNAREQGLWAGDVAVAVLGGLSITDIPVTINKSWYLFVNTDLLNAAGISLSNRILNHAYKSW